MKIDAELRTNKANTGYYIYIPIIEKYVLLEKVEQKLIKLLLEKKDVDKPVTK